MTQTNDGFRISQEDLRLRGPGDFFGQRQHGLPAMKIADLSCDMRLLDEAQTAARQLMERDPELTDPAPPAPAPAHPPAVRHQRRYAELRYENKHRRDSRPSGVFRLFRFYSPS